MLTVLFEMSTALRILTVTVSYCAELRFIPNDVLSLRYCMFYAIYPFLDFGFYATKFAALPTGQILPFATV
jgi:hypothetical protein